MAILAIGAVSASEDISDDVSAIEPADEVISDQIDDNLEETDPQEEILEEETEVKSLNELKDTIENAQGDVVLENNYKYSQGDYNHTDIDFDYSYDLDGQGHTIDGGGKHITFVIWGNDVTVKNLIFKNLNNHDNGHSLIYVNGTGVRIENCTFENITHFGHYAHLIWVKGSNSIISNCTFKDTNSVQFMKIQNDDDPLENVQINNCTFINGNASYSFISAAGNGADKIQVNNCSFEGINATNYLLHIYGNYSQINNCTFKDNIGGYYGFITSQEGNNSIMHNCTFENNAAIDSDNPNSSPIAVFGDTRENSRGPYYVTNVTFINNKGIPIRWYADSGNVTGCVFEGNNGTIDNKGTVYRGNGKYDFEVTVYNDTIAGAPDNPMGYGGYPGYGSQNVLVDLKYYGARTGNIVILLNGTECYNKPLEGDSASIKINELDNVQIGELDIVVKFINGEDDLDLYDDKTKIDYYLAIDGAMMGIIVLPHGTLTLNFTLPKDATGTLIFDDEIQNHTLAYSDGKASFTVKGTDYTELRQYFIALRLIDDPK